MKIIRLKSENIKKITAVEIVPGDGAMVGVAGLNGAGKSSVLDSIAYALGGDRLTPPEPIRDGEAKAEIVVDLGDLLVTRRFKRAALHSDDCATRPPKDGADHVNNACDCEPAFGETTSTLVVANKEGARYPSPQTMLDKLLGRLTFDPLAFSREEPKKQAETLRRLAGLDFSALDARRLEASQNRAALRRVLGDVVARIGAMPQFYEATAEEIPISEITAEMRRAEELRWIAAAAKNEHDVALRDQESLGRAKLNAENKVASLRVEMDAAVEQLRQTMTSLQSAENTVIALGVAVVEAQAAIPDATAIGERMRQVEDNNQKVRANAARRHSEAESADLGERLNAADDAVKACDDERAATMLAARFPVDGLGLGDNGVSWNGLPLEQASQSEKLRVSVAIGLALNPTLRVLLVRDGSLLDAGSQATIAAMAEAAGAQVWCEFVGEGGDGMAVVMEDGHAK